jgi:hypothetical protein
MTAESPPERHFMSDARTTNLACLLIVTEWQPAG